MRLLLFLPILFALAACNLLSSGEKSVTIRGNTMGTTWQVKIVGLGNAPSPGALHREIEETLKLVNDKLSNWIAASEISRFNSSRETSPVSISSDLEAVMLESRRIHELSGGRFDVTVAPLVDLWGFGPKRNSALIPADEDIEKALQKVGMSRLLELKQAPATLKKMDGDVTVNLSAIAKGYGVDRVAATVEKHGITNYLVEIGGDLYSKGNNSAGKPWVIGIERPDENGRSLQKIVKVSNHGLATSGDYRNYVEKDGRRFSHIINPVTGRPITHRLASVTVISDNGMRADGWATALFVAGEDEGMQIAEKLGIAAYFIVREKDSFTERSSGKFQELTGSGEQK